jgi:hypothetical protein
MGKFSKFFTPGFFRRCPGQTAGEGGWVSPALVPSPFYHAEDVEAVHHFFASPEDLTDTNSVPPSVLSGQCFVCDAKVDFIIEQPVKEIPVNWRETVRCPSCKLINRWRACLHLLQAVCEPTPQHRIYLTETLSPVYEQLAAQYPTLSSSEYLPQAKPGEMVKVGNLKVRNEDITQLTFSDERFDALLCFDVLEHVPDYKRALGEFYRVMAHGGQVIISVPFNFQQETTVRAIIGPGGEIEHLEEPCYHGDPLSPDGVLSFYDFGMDLLDEMRTAGFHQSFMLCYRSAQWGYLANNVVFVARKL